MGARVISFFQTGFILKSRLLKWSHKYSCRIAKGVVQNWNVQLGIAEANGLFEELKK